MAFYMYDVRSMRIQAFATADDAQITAREMNRYIKGNGFAVAPGGTFRVANFGAMRQIVRNFMRSGRSCPGARRLGLV